MILYPQVPDALQSQIVQEAQQAARAVEPLSAEKLDSMKYTLVGGARASLSHLRELRASVLAAATEQGFPNKRLTNETKRSTDRKLTEALDVSSAITIGEAALPGIWVFISAILLPDVVNWRWHDETSLERFLGGRRNTFYGYWHRSRILKEDSATDPYWFLNVFGVDNLVQIAERPVLAGCRPVAQALASAMATAMKTKSLSVSEQRFVRDVMARASRAGAIIALRTLDEKGAKDFAIETVQESLSALS